MVPTEAILILDGGKTSNQRARCSPARGLIGSFSDGQFDNGRKPSKYNSEMNTTRRMAERLTSASPDAATGRQVRLPAINCLRASAMTMVVAQHRAPMPCGWNRIWLFYMIAGFVICRTLLTEDSVARRLHYACFIERRSFRIVLD
jgi:hypothetical protein